MRFKLTALQPPTLKEKKVLRLMILLGVLSVIFFLYTMLQTDNISYFPLYVLLMVTLVYYCLKYLHEWYHYFSISADVKPVTTKTYTVDILTTYCAGEPFDMLEETLTAIQNITYPHTAWCCDEADDAEVRNLCNRLGVKHVTRIIKQNAKAGNINNALQQATGEICVVLDPDHIPAPEFLNEVAAYFDDETIGFVQIVQAYYNQEESLVAKGAAQQTYQFYGPMMMGMHKYGTVQAIGANCTFRRSALDSIGGHASGLSEDMHTAMQLHAKGWRSVYVPALLTRGLVPATMSSYYKQQLKWSRGTWELLFTTYPKLFNKFTWRQKIHYFTLPFHYLCGFIFIINFLIPVMSLFTGYIPLQMDVVDFLLAAIPLFSISIIIRHYVQKWVVEEKERGFHLVGGILQIGTWWIHSIGFIYTIFRKKVPYIPTPKNDNDPLPLLLNLPNILVAVISLIAIFYGIWNDYNPYTIFMVGLAFMQISFMVFILFISGYTSNTGKANALAIKFRTNTWLIIKTHGFIRKYSIVLSLMLIVVFAFAYQLQQQLPTFLPQPLPDLQVFYRGVYQQNQDTNINSQYSNQSTSFQKENIAIIAYNIPWGKGEKNKLNTIYLQNIYNRRAIPLLMWQIRQNENIFSDHKKEIQDITTGIYDDAIISFATQIQKLNKPIFLKFSNDSINKKYALFANLNYTPEDFIAAWQHVHQLFDSVGADKVIWIWEPQIPNLASDFFPGKNYVDWIGIDIKELNKNNSISFNALYRPFHIQHVFQVGLPVIVINSRSNNNAQWWDTAWKNIDTAFTEIHSVIINASGYAAADKKINFNTIFTNAPPGSMTLDVHEINRNKTSTATVNKLPDTIKNIVYDKGYYWFRNRHTLSMKTLETDITVIKKMGVNTVERTMPGFYDANLSKVIINNKMNLIPRFGIQGKSSLIADSNQMVHQKEIILKTIKENLFKKYIIAWNMGDDVLYDLANQTYKPDYFYYEQKYIEWLSDLCKKIRILDSLRPIIIDLHWDLNGRKRFKYYKNHVPEINNYMLVADTKYMQGLKENLEKEMRWGKVDVALWPRVPAITKAGTIPAWQDIENTDYVSLNGLLDMEGRKKQWYRKVINQWSNQSINSSPIPEIKILKPAKTTVTNSLLTYRILYNNTSWKIYNGEVKGLHIEWYLVRTDQYGNTMFVKKVGIGLSVELIIPLDPQYYQLYAEAVLGDDVKMISSDLNTKLQ